MVFVDTVPPVDDPIAAIAKVNMMRELLVFSNCRGELHWFDKFAKCASCDSQYSIENDIINMLPNQYAAE